MKRCSYCGCECEDDAGYCSGCGSPIAATPTVRREIPARISQQVREGECSYCGLENAPLREFCSGCGSRLTLASGMIADGDPANVSSASDAIHSENLWVAKDA